jgi:hypothetical protein
MLFFFQKDSVSSTVLQEKCGWKQGIRSTIVCHQSVNTLIPHTSSLDLKYEVLKLSYQV